MGKKSDSKGSLHDEPGKIVESIAEAVFGTKEAKSGETKSSGKSEGKGKK